MRNIVSTDTPVRYETPQNAVTGSKVENTENTASANVTEVSAAEGIQQNNENAMKIPSAYEQFQNRMSLQEDLNNLLKQIMPDLGVQFKVHDGTGQIITSVINNSTKEVVREFPAEKILDLIHNMCQKLGILVNKKV